MKYWKKLLALLLTFATLFPLLSRATLAEEAVTLRVPSMWYLDDAILNAYTAETGVRFQEVELDAPMDAMANAFATRNDQIDLFVFSAHSGLFSIKEHNYYAPLDDSDVMARRIADLYPAFRDALTDEGHLVGWVITAQPMTFSAKESVMEENGLTVPATFDELLDVCQALVDLDVIDQRLILSMTFQYTAEGMLDLYMQEYIRACGMNGGLVDFTRPEFAAMAERIRNELPKTARDIDWEEFEDEVFTYPAAREDIYEGMTPFPQVLDDQQSAVLTMMTVATVNPYAAHRDEAIAFLEYYAAHDTDGYAYDASLTEPVKSDFYVERLREIAVALATLEQLAEPTRDQLDEIANLKEQQAIAEQFQWRVSAEAIASYRDFAQHLVIEEDSPVTYDQVLRAAVGRFLDGAYDGAALARACQEHVAMIYQEHGMAME